MFKPITSNINLPEIMSKVLTYVENQARHSKDAVHPNEWSKPRLPVGSNTPSEKHPKWEEATEEVATERQKFMKRNFREACKAYRYFRKPGAPKHTEISPELLTEIEKIAMDMGASAIGYTTVTPDMIFEGMVIPHAKAIVIVSEMERDAMDKAPHAEVLLEVVKTYATTTEIANALTQHLRDEGFSAFSGIAIGGAVDHVRLAAKANLGAIGYHGLLISPISGTRLRINVLYTNITNLPFAEGNDHEWVLDFCAMCTKCIRGCPPGAIKLNPPRDELGRASTLDNRKCANYMAANHTCSICMSICPFSRAGYDKIKANFKGPSHQDSHEATQIQIRIN